MLLTKDDGKHPRLLELNPKGQVPTLEIPPQSYEEKSWTKTEKLQNINETIVLKESMDCMVFLNSLADKDVMGTAKDLFRDPTFLSDAMKYDKNIATLFYYVLIEPTQEKQREAFVSFATNITEFLENVYDDGFYKSSTVTAVDFSTIPWMLRIHVLNHYRPMFKFEDVMDKDTIEKFEKYLARMKALPVVQKTMWDDESAMNGVYKRYAGEDS